MATVGGHEAGWRAQAPVRLVDSRIGLGGPTGRRRTFTIAVPPGPAVELTLTHVTPASSSYLTVYPAPIGGVCPAPPLVSIVNTATGQVSANSAVVAAESGVVCVSSPVVTHLVVDLVGTITATQG